MPESNDTLSPEILERLKQLVDEEFYFNSYPEIKTAKLSAAEHFVKHGMHEGRQPNALFDVELYYNQVPELYSSGENPYLHYLRCGRAQGVICEKPKVLIRGHNGNNRQLGDAAIGSNAARLLAWYLPQFHPVVENDMAWGTGFTEWSNVSSATPRFKGHYQPRLPGALGFYNLSHKETLEEQISLAKHSGIYGFCFHYYWFAGKKLLHTPLEHFKNNPNIDFKFCLHWANESWSRRWDGANNDVIALQTHSTRDDHAFIKDIAWALKDPRYIKFEGKPLLGVYRPDLFPDMAATLKLWRDYCRYQGIGEIFVFIPKAFNNTKFAMSKYGFDGMVEYPPHQLPFGRLNHEYLQRDLNYPGTIASYIEARNNYLYRSMEPYDFTCFRGVMTGWDNSSRNLLGRVFEHATPDAYGEWLESAVALSTRDQYSGEKYIFINAWNEWAEAAYLEPDAKYGFALLNTTARVMGAHSWARLPRVLFVVDMHNKDEMQRLKKALTANSANPQINPVILTLHPEHNIGTLDGLAPIIMQPENADANKIKGALAAAGYWQFAATIFFKNPDSAVLKALGGRAGEVRLCGAGEEIIPPAEVMEAAWLKQDILLSIITLPGGNVNNSAILAKWAKQSAKYKMEVLAPLCLKESASGLMPPDTCFIDDSGDYVAKALRSAKGEFIWLLAPEEFPDSNTPSLLLAAFAAEGISSARCYVSADIDPVPHVFKNNTYKLKGDTIIERASIMGVNLLPCLSGTVFRREELVSLFTEIGSASDSAGFWHELCKKSYKGKYISIIPSELTAKFIT